MTLNAGAEIYNRAKVTGGDSAGQSFQRTVARPGTLRLPITGGPVATNPSADVNVANWTLAGGSSTLVRDTVVFRSTPASFKMGDTSGFIPGNRILDADLSNSYTFRSNLIYCLRVFVQASAVGAAASLLFGNYNASIITTNGPGGSPYRTIATGGDYGRTDLILPTTFGAAEVIWQPDVDQTLTVPGFRFVAGDAVTPANVWFDSVSILRAGETLVDRRGFVRSMELPVSTAFPTGDFSAQDALGDIWLGQHERTPFRGSIAVTGDGAVREALTGQSVPPGVLLTRTNELIRLIDRVDPDTGALGRDGRIAAVSYVPATQTAQVTLDNVNNNLSALLSRMSVVVDNTRPAR